MMRFIENLVLLCLFIMGAIVISQLTVELFKWECSARDVRNGQCVEYSLKKFPETVNYEGEK